MSTEYSGNPANYPTTITRPSDGDNKPAASVNNGFEDLADRTAFLKAHTPGIGELATGAVGGPFIVPLPTFEAVRLGDFAEWEPHVGSNLGIGWLQAGVTGLGGLYWSLPHFPGMRIRNIGAHFNTQTGRSGLPAEQPQIVLQRAIAPALLSGSPDYEEIATSQRAAPNLTDYETENRFSLSFVIATLEANGTDFRWEDPMFFLVIGEHGTNAMAEKLFLERVTMFVEPA